MRAVSRKFKRHFGVSAKLVAVRSKQPWYIKLVTYFALIVLGYCLAYWQISSGYFIHLRKNLTPTAQENQSLHAKIVQMERQLQVEHAAQVSLTKTLLDQQDEDMRLKEDVVFYKSILSENKGAGELKLYSFKLNKGAQVNQYDYSILLVQLGRQDKIIQGTLKLTIDADQNGQAITPPLADNLPTVQPVKINFKYYQRIEGSFTVPASTNARSLQANFIETGANQPRISQRVDFPG